MLRLTTYGLYPSVLQVFLATFYRYNQDYLEMFTAADAADTPLTITGDTIIKAVESPDKYILHYQPLPEEQRQFLRGLVERALYPGRPIQLRRGETASLRNRVAKLLQLWVGEQVPVIARQATTDQLASVLEDTPTEVIDAAIAFWAWLLIILTGVNRTLTRHWPIWKALASP